jgi:hypothetical protein
VPKSQTEKPVEDMPKMAVKLQGYANYHHLEADEQKHDGDVVEVEEGRARALISQGYAVPVEADQRSRRK